jgi:hypothetical protein
VSLHDIAQESVFAAGIAATWARELPVHRSGLIDVTVRSGTRVSLRIDPGGMFVHATPALRVVLRGPLPDVSFDTASYDFHASRFDVSADAGLAGPVLEAVVERWLNGTLRKRLPAPLLRRDYAPQADPDLAGTVRSIAGLLPLGADDGGSAGGLPEELRDAHELAAHLTLQLRRDVAIAIPGLDGMEVRLPKGARLFIDVRTEGAASTPSLHEVVVQAQGRGVVIASTGTGLLDALESIEVTRMTIRPGPKLAFRYELLIERLLNAPALLSRFAQVLAGRYSPDAQGDIVLDSLRANITLMLDEAVGGLLRDLLAEYDRVLPGISLRALFTAP